MIKKINTIEDVIILTKELIDEGTNFHPDDDFRNIINIETNLPTYTEEEAHIRNNLIQQCFVTCDLEGKDIYEIMFDTFISETKLNDI